MKKLLSMLLIVTMLLTSVLVIVPTVGAAEGDGTNAELEAQGYKGITALNQITAGGKFYLKNDVTVTGSLGNYPNGAVLDGNGKTITVNSNTSIWVWADGATIKNLKLKGTVTSTAIGSVDGSNQNQRYNEGVLTKGFEGNVLLENITSDVNLVLEGGTFRFVGFYGKSEGANTLTMKNVVNNGNITVKADTKVERLGGIIGWVGGTARFTDCAFNGNITIAGTPSRVGGIVGVATGSAITLENCSNTGNISFDTAYANIKGICMGGIIGLAETGNTVVTGCKNSGIIKNTNKYDETYVGGIVGKANFGCSVSDCINNGTIVGGNKNGGSNTGYGGIVGTFYSAGRSNTAFSVNRCLNTAKIDVTGSAMHVAGIVGEAYAVPSLTITNSLNTGEIAHGSASAYNGSAGILGTFMCVNSDPAWTWSNVTHGNLTIQNCHNVGTIWGDFSAGIWGSGRELFEADSAILVENCSNQGQINGWTVGGGIVGGYSLDNGCQFGNVTVRNCYNGGKVYANKESDPKVGDDGNAAGIVGRIWANGSCGTTTIENCANAAAATGKWASQGLLAWANHAVKIENCADSVMPSIAALSDRTNVASNNLIGSGAAAKVATIKATALGQGGIPYVISEGQLIKANGLKNVYIMNDLTLTVKQPGNFENGTIYGQGKTITLDGAPCVIWWGSNVTVQDLIIDGTIVMNAQNKTDHVGPLSMHGFSGNSVIRNVRSDVDITVDAAAGSVGGVISKNDGTILFENVEYTGDLVLNVSTTQSFGGIIGWPKTATFKNVANSGSMTANANSGWGKIGAIAGDINGSYTFENVVNKADLTLNAGCTSQYVGGIAGGIEPNSYVKFKNVRNEGTITSVATRQVGGIMGRACNATIIFENVENTGDIIANGRSNVGGIAGLFDYCSVIAENIRNTGDVTVNVEQAGDHRGIGGLFGCYDGNNNAAKSLTVTNATNTGDVSFIKKGAGSKDVHVSGGIGRIYRAKTVTLTNIVNAGNVNYDGGNQVGWECVGGVVGGIMTYSDAAIYNITGCTNIGAVTTTGGIAGGILGGTKQLASDKIALTIDNCVNFGEITAKSNTAHAGGIAGDIGGSGNGFWNLTIKNSANSGKIFVENGWCVGGILGQFDKTNTTKAATIENCVNAGEVHLNKSPWRNGDTWSCAAGIVGSILNPINVKNCSNTGYVHTNSAVSAFPIANCCETRGLGENKFDATLLIAEGNLYLEDSATMSDEIYAPTGAVATKAEIYARVAENEMRMYDTATLSALVDAMNKYSADKWTPESYENLMDVVNEATDLLDTISDAETYAELFANKQAPLNAAELKIRAAKSNLKLAGTGVTDELKIALDNAKAEAVGGKYTTESWAVYQQALAKAEALISQGNAADPVEVEKAIADLEAATEALVIGGAIRNAEDFAAMDGQDGVFTLEADITVSAPLKNFKGTLIGNGHIITAESALFETMEDATIFDLVIIGGDIDADSLFGTAKGELNTVANVVIMINSINSAVLFNEVEGVAEDVEIESGSPDTIVYVVGTTVIVNDAVNGEAGLIATAGRSTGIAFVDVMFLGDVNGKAALVGESESLVAIAATVVYSNITAEEAAAGLVYSAEQVAFMGIYFEGVIDAEETHAFYVELANSEIAGQNIAYAYALNADGSLVEGCDLDAIRSGEATYMMNKAYESLEDDMMFNGLVNTDMVFVQRIGLDATPVMGKAYADNSNVVYYDAETDTYYNNVVYADGEFAELPTPSAPLAPDYDALNATIEKVEGIDSEGYTTETWAALEAALEAALAARTSRDQADIDAALADLLLAVAGLRKTLPETSDATVDVSGLTASIQAAEALKAEDYTAESWAVVQAVLASAKATLTSNSQALVDNAKASLDAMVAGLVKKTVEAPAAIDYTKLNATIASAETLVEAKYTAETWATLKAMLEVAKSAKTSNSQAAVDQAETSLARAIAGLITAPAEKPVEEDGGCGSAITGTAMALVAVIALGAGVSFKKKED